jgi:hypothetical protein
VIEIMTFRLVDGADERAFRDIDRRVQVEVAYQQPGLARRTLARSGDRWLVLQIWTTPQAAQAGGAAFDASPLGAHFLGFVDAGSVVVERFGDVD